MNLTVRMEASDFIDALGGTAEVGRLAGVKPSAVSNWRRLGAIPPRLFLRLREVSRARGIEAPEEVFRETPDPRKGAAAEIEAA